MVVNFANGLKCSDIKYNINFRSSAQPVQELKQDTVEIKTKEKEGMPKSLKWALGIGGSGLALYGALVTHRAHSKPSLEVLKKDLSEVLRRNIGDDELKGMLKNYKSIMKIKDKKEFCQKAFDQIKKDYGYKDLDINLTLNDTTDTIFGGLWMGTGEAFHVFYNNIIEACGGKFNKQTKAQILDILFHEFQHAKQTEYCMRTNPEKYYEALISEKIMTPRFIAIAKTILGNESQIKQWAAIMKLSPEEYKKSLEKNLETLETKGYKAIPDYVKQVDAQMIPIKERLYKLFGGFEVFVPGTKEYELGEQYIKNYGEYVEAVAGSKNKEYFNQIVEKEAHKAGETSYNIPERTESIWNIFAPIKYKSILNPTEAKK